MDIWASSQAHWRPNIPEEFTILTEAPAGNGSQSPPNCAENALPTPCPPHAAGPRAGGRRSPVISGNILIHCSTWHLLWTFQEQSSKINVRVQPPRQLASPGCDFQPRPGQEADGGSCRPGSHKLLQGDKALGPDVSTAAWGPRVAVPGCLAMRRPGPLSCPCHLAHAQRLGLVAVTIAFVPLPLASSPFLSDGVRHCCLHWAGP